MGQLLLFLGTFLSLFVSVFSGETEEKSAIDNFKVVAYVPEYRLHAISWEAAGPLLSHAILFSLEMHRSGDLLATDRLPDAENWKELQKTREGSNMKVLIGFGGNGRSAGFAPMTANANSRKKFISRVVELVEEYQLDGVDYNWEYPGFRFGQGYLPNNQIKDEFNGLQNLVKETREAFNKLPRSLEITLAYYPDGKQERLFKSYGILKHVDLAHAMAYDQGGYDHSPLSLVETVISNAKNSKLDLKKITVGLPFYGRDERTGQAETYEEILKIDPDKARYRGNDVIHRGGRALRYNGPKMIEKKTMMALEAGLGGVMIWELGQDCRLKEVTRNQQTHPKTCPGQTNSLLFSIKMGRKQYKLDLSKKERMHQMGVEAEEKRKAKQQKKEKEEL